MRLCTSQPWTQLSKTMLFHLYSHVYVVIISTNKTMTENQIALLKIVVFLEYVSHGYRKGKVILAAAPT